ncbi:5-oxoprolinase subunit PxpA [Pseudonocardia sp. H11422]|uniref:LamB/YcsF family protein n=1 Tax=Pseudonocardia sp. H11422 TaxID=2835866 RepID=UPI0027E22B7F|nr:5-oxoprolinase subunit PxpA [Pseudonocardia sp. H11422]
MGARVIDLNCDVGEGFGSWRMGPDEALLRIVSSANVACGFHGGDPSWMRRTCDAAIAGGVAIGAHVGFPDLAGFGRRHLEMSVPELTDAVLYQIGALDAFARTGGDRVRYVKPHGALYHAAAQREDHAAAVVAAVGEFDAELAVVAPPGSRLLVAAAAAGLAAAAEGFADRAYTADGGLMPRSQPGAVLTDPDAIGRQAVALAEDTAGGPADAVGTLCVHSDTPGAERVARAVRAALERAGFTVAAFTAVPAAP